MLTVHHLRQSQSERIVWLCEELGIDYELKLYDRAPVLAPPELANLHPTGAAPVITDTDTADGKPLVLAETAAIADYINYKYGGGRLAARLSDPSYADYLYWFHFANGSLQPAVTRSIFFAGLKLPADNSWQQLVDRKLKGVVEMINGRLAKSKWLAGDEFTAADVMSVFSLSTSRVFLPLDLSDKPGILRWFQDVKKRPAYLKAMEKAEPGVEPALNAENPPRFAAMP